MLSFPSTLNTGGNNIDLPTIPRRSPLDILKNMGQSFVNSAVNTAVGNVYAALNGAASSTVRPDVSRLPYDYTVDPSIVKKNIFSEKIVGIQPSLHGRPQYWTKGSLPVGSTYSTNDDSSGNKWNYLKSSSPLIFDPQVYSIMNMYRYVYSSGVFIPIDAVINDKNGNPSDQVFGRFSQGSVSPSLFNPYYGIQKIGATRNTPLTDTSPIIKGTDFESDFTDCSISTLCNLSAIDSTNLGQARYKYSDFMYCKDLGMPNNRMITLRKFSSPVGDMIMGKLAASKEGPRSVPGDIGRLVGYFDTEDNKLEDILNYSFSASWKPVEGKYEGQESQEDDRTSPLGMVLNTMSSSYRKTYEQSRTGNNNLLDYFLGRSRLGRLGDTSSWYKGNKIFTHYDDHKVYDPINTVRDTHLYEGVLKFSNEFTLTFNYTLRSYDNINPKSAMLDLLANITAVTYKRGHFWGGRNEIIGAQPNTSGWQMANSIIDKKFDQIGGVFTSLFNGGLNLSGMLGNMANFLTSAFGDAAKTITDAVQNPQETVEKVKEGSQELLDKGKKVVESPKVQKAIKTGAAAIGGMIKGKLKDCMGRPQAYAFNSLLTGADVGLWHVTIGNPRNPIAVMGNMIVTDTKVTQYGPLGIDDFPTGIKVQVTLKHARSRDMVDIQKMYTRGVAAIYTPMNNPEGLGGRDSVHYTNKGNGILYVGDYDKERIKRNIDEVR